MEGGREREGVRKMKNRMVRKVRKLGVKRGENGKEHKEGGRLRRGGRVRMTRNAEMLRNTKKVGRMGKIRSVGRGKSGEELVQLVDASPPSYMYNVKRHQKIQRCTSPRH